MTDPIKPRWRQMDSGDWAYEQGKGGDVVRLGTVVSQNMGGKRSWFSVSATASHGPEEGNLTVCKRRVEGLF